MKLHSLGSLTSLVILCFFWNLNCVSNPKVQDRTRTPERMTLSSSTGLVNNYQSLPFGIYPGYIQDPEQFRRVNLGIGSFQGRHLLEDEVRKAAQRNVGTSNAYRTHGESSGGFFGQFAPKN